MVLSKKSQILWPYSGCWSELSGEGKCQDHFFISGSEVCKKLNWRVTEAHFCLFVCLFWICSGTKNAHRTSFSLWKCPFSCEVFSTGRPAKSTSRQVMTQNASKVESLLMSGQKNHLSLTVQLQNIILRRNARRKNNGPQFAFHLVFPYQHLYKL